MRQGWGLAAVFAGLFSFPAAASAAELDPYVAVYDVVYHGIRAGESRFELTQLSPTRYRYVSRSNARGLFRLAFGHEIVQESVLELDHGTVRPVSFKGDDGSSDTRKDVRLEFDWSKGRIHGVQEDKPVDLAIVPDVQDALSAQISLVHALRQGVAPPSYQLVDGSRLETYRTVAEGSERLATAAGIFDTVVFRSRREGAKHSIRIWLAPALGYAPVQAEQQREDKRVWIMRVRSVSRGP